MNLEIMGTMLFCLVAVGVLGFVIGWLFSRALNSEKYDEGENSKSKSKNELNKIVEELEKKYEKEKTLLADYAEKNRELKGELMKKMSILQSTSDRLKEMQGYDKDSSVRVGELEALLRKKEYELMEFETVLVKAEKTIEQLSKK